MVKVSEYYQKIGQQVMEEVPELKHLLTDDVRICFMASNQKKMAKGREVCGECIKVQDLYKAFCPYDFLIVFYDPNTTDFDDKRLKILAEHELLHVGVEEKDGEMRYSIVPHDYDDFRQITKKYGTEWARLADA